MYNDKVTSQETSQENLLCGFFNIDCLLLIVEQPTTFFFRMSQPLKIQVITNDNK